MTDLPNPAKPNAPISHEVAIGCALGSVICVESGAALGKGLFDLIPALSVAWLRFTFATLVLVVLQTVTTRVRHARHLGSRSRTPLSRRSLLALAGYSVALITMNTAFYLAIRTIPLGIAVTIEYLGPLAVAIIGSRGRLDLLWAGLAGLGVVLLGFRPEPLDPTGLGFVLVAACCWAGYIMLGARAREYWRGADLVTIACASGAVVLAFPAIHAGGGPLWTPGVLIMGLVVGVFSSVLPYRLDLIALGGISPNIFSILQSLAPAAAAIAGWVLLGEVLGLTDWMALAAVAIASAGATIASSGR
ncbi:EamA family transporter [Brooklawnia sp.]|uniref:EamA family transporter n=1 Tax=Brooklawnia sp. TaxID=2699740 RepID=UPI00311DA290